MEIKTKDEKYKNVKAWFDTTAVLIITILLGYIAYIVNARL